MKTKEELNALKEEVETLNRKLAKLNVEEVEQVTGGVLPLFRYGHVSITSPPVSQTDDLPPRAADLTNNKNN